jgi:hypothetical protein
MDQHRIRAPRHRRISSAWLAVTPQTIRLTCARPSTCRPFGQ